MNLSLEIMCRGSIKLGTGCRKCSRCLEQMKATRQEGCPDKTADLDLERRALKACGYRVHEKERNGTRWLMAVKGLEVQYKHWHPLTSIHQAMQLLIDLGLWLDVGSTCVEVRKTGQYPEDEPVACIDTVSRDAQSLIAAQCRAIVTACASLEPVR